MSSSISELGSELTFLVEAGLISDVDTAQASRLSGGVSSDIWLVTDGDRRVVVKRPLAALKVPGEWRVSVDRSRSEAEWLQVVHELIPGVCPQVYAFDSARNMLALEYLEPDRHPIWKQQLLHGEVDPSTAAAVGDRLGTIHAMTSTVPSLAEQFATDALFWDLRLEPYLDRLRVVHPELSPQLEAVIDQTRSTKLALVHGDVSPKNILVGPSGPVFLDAECAWWGDPAFDLAFCLNHLILKCARPEAPVPLLLSSYDELTAAYLASVAWEDPAQLIQRTASLLPALTLARVDGRSPVEYLDPEGQQVVRGFALELLTAQPVDLAHIRESWRLKVS